MQWLKKLNFDCLIDLLKTQALCNFYDVFPIKNLSYFIWRQGRVNVKPNLIS